MTTIDDNLQSVRRRIVQACNACGRAPATVQLLAVSKTFGADAVRQAWAAGQRCFGENYVQEAVEKIQALADLPLEWHCIGPVQSNKTRVVASHFDWVHTVDRLKVAERLQAQRPEGLPALNVCIQVNVDGGVTKSGVPAQDALPLAREVAAMPRLRLRGIMTIPEPGPGLLQAHRTAQEILNMLRSSGLDLDTLSMGMSADLEDAVACGSTLVRVGSAIFGTRPPKL